MDQEKAIKLTLASQVASRVVEFYIRNSNNQEEIATNTVNLTKLIVDKLYEGI